MKAREVKLSRRRPLRVLTLNIWGFTEPYARRMKLVRDNIRRLDPDLLSFQEAARDGERDQIAPLLDGLGYHIIHQFDGRPSAKTEDACCVASRWPVKLVENLSLQITKTSKRYPYAALAVRVAAPDPVGEFLFVGAKPSWELNREDDRERQAVAMVEMIARHADAEAFPTIIAGDFDATPDSASIRFFTGKQSLAGRSVHFLDAWHIGAAEQNARDASGGGHTWTHRNPAPRGIIAKWRFGERHARRIDYILLGSPHDYRRYANIRTCRVELNRPRGGVWPSDHFAGYAEIDVTR